MDKYYLHSYTAKAYRSGEYLIRDNPNLSITINENTDMPGFDLYLNKFEGNKVSRPKNTEYEIYKPIPKETYHSYFQSLLKSFRNLEWEDAEYYIKPSSAATFDLMMYTTDLKNKFCIHLQVFDSIKDLSLTVWQSVSFTERPGWRKNGKPISETIFVSALKETIKFINDENSYAINSTEYIEKMNLIVQGDITEIEPKEIANVDQLIKQLEIKKNDITTRLIENDSDSENIRAGLRGEKEGIEYSLRVIKKFFRLA